MSANSTYIPLQPVFYEAVELNKTIFYWLFSNLTYEDHHLRTILENLSALYSETNQYDSVHMSDEQLEEFIREKLIEKPYGDATQGIIITLFVVLMLFGALGNSLVCWVVLCNPKMRTQRNIFVVNLAISDLTLCVITQAFNLYRLLMNEWRLGVAICKLGSMFAATNVFVSTASITAIALDRFHVIVYPMSQSRTGSDRIHSFSFLLIIWLVSLAMASPLAVFNKTEEVTFAGRVVFLYCVENYHMVEQRKAYSIALLIIQYVLPIVTVCVAHARISRKLRYRLVTTTSLVALSAQQHTKIACPGGKIITDVCGSQKAERTGLTSISPPEGVASCEPSQNSKHAPLERSGSALNNLSNGLKRVNNRRLEVPTKYTLDQSSEFSESNLQQIPSSFKCNNMPDNQTTNHKEDAGYTPVLLRETAQTAICQQTLTTTNQKPIEFDNSQKTEETDKNQAADGCFGENLANLMTTSIPTDDESPRVRRNLADELNRDQSLAKPSCNKKIYRCNSEIGNQDAPILACPATLTGACESDAVTFLANKRRRELSRKRRTNTLLVLIAVIFAASWMPLNLANILVDFYGHLMASLQKSINNLLFPICHLIVLCSACLNPLLYGWLNDNFRREFVKVLGCSYIVHLLAPRLACCSPWAKSLDSGSLYCCCSPARASTSTLPAQEIMAEPIERRGGCCNSLCHRKDNK